MTVKAQAGPQGHTDKASGIAQISGIIQDQGLSLTGLTFAATEGLPNEQSQSMPSGISGILVMPVQFDTEGSFSQLSRMLESFEHQARFMRVSDLNINRNDNGSLNASLTVEVFFKP